MENTMFCYQCQETAGCTGCTKYGVCGKSPQTAKLQDILIYVTKGLSEVTTKLRRESKTVDKYTDMLIVDNLFITITNANFDNNIITEKIRETISQRDKLISDLSDNRCLSPAAHWQMSDSDKNIGVLSTLDEDYRSLRELITYGLKGMAAYIKHASALGYDDNHINAFYRKAFQNLQMMI